MLTSYYVIDENYLYSKLVNDLEIILFAQQKKPLDPMQPKMKIGWMQQKL